MYDYKISDDVRKKVLSIENQTHRNEKVSDLINKIDTINSKFKLDGGVIDAPENIELERKEFTNLTEDEIKNKAESELSDYKNKEINSIEQGFGLKEQQLSSNKEYLADKSQSDNKTVESYYDGAKENANTNALKRGLSRSSIVINQLNAFESSQIESLMELDKEYGSKIDAINFELSGLSSELEGALGDFDISYAVKLQDKINKLTTDLSTQESGVIEYNNKIALQEAEFNSNVAKLKATMENDDWDKTLDIAEFYGKYGANVVAKVIQDSVLDSTKQSLSGLTKSEAVELLNDPTVKSKLGNLYDILIKEYI